MKIVLTGGGTAGHVIPNLALVDELKKSFNEIYYIGSGKALESNLITPYNIPYYAVETPKLKRKLTLENCKIPFQLFKSIKECTKILQELKPDIVFSKGGYVSLPVVISAHKLKIKIVAHESDISMGLANKIATRYCNKICTTFENTGKGKKFVYTGAPVRSTFHSANVARKFHNNLPTILFVGGSQGATEINTFVESNFANLTKNYNIIHLCGKNKLIKTPKTTFKPNYLQMEFSNDMPDLINQSDIVVTRGGSNALFEILAIGKPMIIYPLSKKQSRGDQIENATFFHKNKLGYYIKELNTDALIETATELLKNKSEIIAKQKQYYKQGNKNIVSVILDEVNKN